MDHIEYIDGDIIEDFLKSRPLVCETTPEDLEVLEEEYGFKIDGHSLEVGIAIGIHYALSGAYYKTMLGRSI